MQTSCYGGCQVSKKICKNRQRDGIARSGDIIYTVYHVYCVIGASDKEDNAIHVQRLRNTRIVGTYHFAINYYGDNKTFFFDKGRTHPVKGIAI